MDSRRQVDVVTGRTFTSPSYTQNQIIPYSQNQIVSYSSGRPDYGNSYNNNNVYRYDISPGKSQKSKSFSSWSLDDPELKRRKRVASYKVYSVEGRFKSSIRKSFRWFKDKYYEMRYGWW